MSKLRNIIDDYRTVILVAVTGIIAGPVSAYVSNHVTGVLFWVDVVFLFIAGVIIVCLAYNNDDYIESLASQIVWYEQEASVGPETNEPPVDYTGHM